MNFFALAAATFFMVSGGPYGLEELVQSAGYTGAVLLLFLVPLLWALPTGLMVGELGAAIPDEGGFYVWVRRALGPFWGFQEAWLSLMASIFDMAAYPAVFILALSQLWPPAKEDSTRMMLSAAIIGACLLWNLCGARAVGDGSILLGVVLLAPFALLVWFGAFELHVPSTPPDPIHPNWVAGLVIAMWNYMGWDNASTIAGEVRNPQRTYPRVMLWTLAAILAVYVIPVLAARHAGIPIDKWTTGNWVGIGASIAGPWLGVALLITTMVSTFGMFNSLMLSYSRLPLVLAEDGLAPRVFSRKLPNGAPWVSLAACSVAWMLATGLSFERILLLDVLLYGASLLLEFAALLVLRRSEPDLPRPFRAPFAAVLGIGPAILLGIAFVNNRADRIGNVSALTLSVGLAVAGVGIYFLVRGSKQIRP
jgi:amino acid transporter